MAIAYPIRNGRVVLYPERLFGRSAPVGRWAADVAQKMWTYTEAEAPQRTGRLRSSIRAWSLRSGPTEVEMRLNIGVFYAGYVLYGTDSPIESRSGSLMPVGKSQPEPRANWTWRQAVMGQQANNFVKRGMLRVERRHPSVGASHWNDLSQPFGRGGSVL